MTSLHAQLERDPLALRVLRGLYDLAQADVPAEPFALGRMLGVRPSEVAFGLSRLERLGLACAERARLTMRGLAVAVRLPAMGVAAALRPKQEADQPSAWPAPSGAPRARLLLLPGGRRTPRPRMASRARKNHAGSGRFSGVASSGVARRAASR